MIRYFKLFFGLKPEPVPSIPINPPAEESPEPPRAKTLYNMAIDGDDRSEGTGDDLYATSPYLQWIRDAVDHGWHLAVGDKNTDQVCELMTRSRFATVKIGEHPGITVWNLATGKNFVVSPPYSAAEINELLS